MNATGDRLSSLMERYARGEDRVFEQLYRLLAPRLYRFCLRLAANVVEADDCFQETFSALASCARDLRHRCESAVLGFRNCALGLSDTIALLASPAGATRRVADVAEAGDLQAHETTPEAELAAQHLHDTLACELGKMSEKNRVRLCAAERGKPERPRSRCGARHERRRREAASASRLSRVSSPR
jgi:hypothetical protein